LDKHCEKQKSEKTKRRAESTDLVIGENPADLFDIGAGGFESAIGVGDVSEGGGVAAGGGVGHPNH